MIFFSNFILKYYNEIWSLKHLNKWIKSIIVLNNMYLYVYLLRMNKYRQNSPLKCELKRETSSSPSLNDLRIDPGRFLAATNNVLQFFLSYIFTTQSGNPLDLSRFCRIPFIRNLFGYPLGLFPSGCHSIITPTLAFSVPHSKSAALAAAGDRIWASHRHGCCCGQQRVGRRRLRVTLFPRFGHRQTFYGVNFKS